MEGKDLSASDQVLQTAKDDIASTIQRKNTLMALLPVDDDTFETFAYHLLKGGQSHRKRILMLCPPYHVGRSRTILRRLLDRISPETLLAAIDPEDLTCLSEGFKASPAAISHFCYTDDCHRSCPYQSGFSIDIYRRIKESSGSLEGMDEGLFRDSGMCPSRTLMDIASEASVLVFDHSLMISPGFQRTIGHIGLEPADTLLCMMDPVSFVEKVWEVHSLKLTSPMLQTSYWPFSALSEMEIQGMETLFQVLREFIQKNDDGATIDRKQLIDDLRREMKEFDKKYSLTDIAQILSALSSGVSDLSFSDRVRLRYLEDFISVWFEQHSTASRYVLNEREMSINISLIAPQVVTSSITSMFHSSVIFGDNVYPHDIFTRLLGLPLNRVSNRTYVSAGKMKDITVLAFTNVDLTSRTDMEEQYRTVAENMRLIVGSLSGRSLFVFPSYNALDSCAGKFLEGNLKGPVFEETRDMHKEEKEAMLVEFRDSIDGVALAVQNGIIARSFESGSLRVSTSVMVGLQFNPPSPESNQKKIFFHDNYGSNTGELISRVLPAMQKAIRMVNSQMYAPSEKRFVILMDRRYQDRRNMIAIPSFWDVKFISDPRNLRFDLFKEG
ncbi:MAG: helicase C-terminal domain-containing protein [Candidatus Thermoplasmatota archaeon]|nr:helicase C-terminal domain-containing protein [Candidatus Thermoplasmatota archaeon]